MVAPDSRSRWSRLRAFYRGVALMVFNVLLLLVLLELGTRVLRTLDRRPGIRVDREMVTTAALSELEWFDTYWKEHEESGRKRYSPFTVWRSRPFEGETINIDERGVRATPGAHCADGAYKVFTFGGSSMWGHGVPDWETIPAHLQPGLTAAFQRRICVENFGERGWVSTQGVIELNRQIQIGNVPDLVISYEGVNDISSAFQTGRPDAHLDLDTISERFEGSPWVMIETSGLAWTLRRLGLVDRTRSPTLVTGDPETVAREAVRAYLANCDLVESLASEHDFEALFFWQPVLFEGSKPLARSEQRIVDALVNRYPQLSTWYSVAYSEIRGASVQRSNLHYLGGVFDGCFEQAYIDFVHLTPDGNRRVAERILEICQTEPEKVTRTASGHGPKGELVRINDLARNSVVLMSDRQQ